MLLSKRLRSLTMVVIACIAMVAGLAAPTQATSSSSATEWSTTEGVGSDVAIVFIPGLAGLSTQVEPLLPTLTAEGDVYAVDFKGARFDADAAASEIANKFASLVSTGKTVVVLGSSMGGNVAADAIEKLDPGVREHVRLALVCTPYGDALNEPFKTVVQTSVALPHELGGTVLWTAQTLAPLLAGSTPELPAVSPSVLYDQAKYIYTYEAGSPLNVPAVYIQASNDGVVAPQALQRWSALSPGLPVVPVTGGHTNYADDPQAWRSAVSSALTAFGI